MKVSVKLKSSNRLKSLVLAYFFSWGSLGPVQAAALDLSRGSDKLVQMIEAAEEMGSQSAYVFDLDETVVDSTRRRFAAYREAVSEICLILPVPSPDLPPEDCPALETLELERLYGMQNRYDDTAYLKASGVRDPRTIERVSSRMFEIYLSGAYIVEEDRMLPYALGFLRALQRAGANLYFVSSRSEKHQWGPTVEFLKRRGLIRRGEEDRLFLKPEGETSPDFKYRVTNQIARKMKSLEIEVVGIFENEPENLELWMHNFPEAQPFFVRGAYQKSAPVSKAAVLLDDFRLE